MRCLNCGQEDLDLSITNCPKCKVNLASLMGDALYPGTVLDKKYTIEYPLGRGGFGITYCAQHTRTEQKLAIKEFYPREHAVREATTGSLTVLDSSSIPYQRGVKSFLREAKTLAKLNHPNIVRVQDFFEEKGSAYIVMELINGSNLRQELNAQANKCFSSEVTKKLMSALVEALAEIHNAAIYHLDLKPENILLTPKQRVVLVDFGAAKQGMSNGTTRAFTLDYAAPEVISGDEVGSYSDIFELGMMLYEMLTGKRPPTAMSRFINNTWTPTDLEEPWQTLVNQALQLQKKERPENVKDWWYRVFPPASKNLAATAIDIPVFASQQKSRSSLAAAQKNLPSEAIARTSKTAKIKTKLNSNLVLQKLEFETVTLKKESKWFGLKAKINLEPRAGKTTYFKEYLNEDIALETLSIPGGTFIMGAPTTEKDSQDNERPQHQVKIPSFLMGKFPITQAQWRIVAGFDRVARSLNPNPSHFQGDDLPVEKVSWYDAIEFCQRLSQKTGRTYRLPSEAEWEYACRANTYTPFCFGETISGDLANYDASITYAFEPSGEWLEKTVPVGSFAPNAFGLYDMHGLIWEWCADLWHDNYQNSPNNELPWLEAGEDGFSPLRGGSWSLDPASCRCANRLKLNRSIDYKYFGFRVVLDILKS